MAKSFTKTLRAPQYERRMQRSRQEYLNALDRLIRGIPRHPQFQKMLAAGRHYAISVASVAKEAGRTRNPLYEHYPDVIAKIKKSAAGDQTPTKMATAQNKITELRERAARLAREKASAATQNLALLVRLEKANERIARLERDLARVTRQLHETVPLQALRGGKAGA